jgi:hypothetical protein
MSYAALQAMSRRSSSVSEEGLFVSQAAAAIVDAREQSYALFGQQNGVISQIRSLAVECGKPDWNGDGALPVDSAATRTAESIVRALPEGFPVPEVSAEPDGAISLDWAHSRSRVFTLSAGPTDRLAFAWLDGTDKGHGVARFDGITIPRRVIDGIRSILSSDPTVRAA